MTSQQYQTSLFEESDVWTLSVEDFRARLSRLQETDEVLKIHEEVSSLKLQGSHLFSDLNIYSLRTSKDSSIMKTELRLRPLSQPWMNWGTMWIGVPQNRERVFIIGHSRRYRSRRIFPLSSTGRQVDKHQEQSTNTLTTRYPNSQGVGSYIIESESQKVKSIGNINPSGNGMNGEVYQADGLAPTLTTNKGEGQKIAIPVLTPDRTDKRQNGRRFKSDGEPMFTLTAQDKHGILIAGKLPGNHDQNSRVYDTDGLAPTLSTMQGGGQEPKIIQRGHGYNQGGEHDIAPVITSNSYQENNHLSDGYRIRKLTPRECWRLQGFPDWAFDKAQEVNSNSQLYKQAGNSVTVNVIAAIAKELK